MLRGRPGGKEDGRRQQWALVLALAVLVLATSPRALRSNTISALSWGHDSAGRTTVMITCAEAIADSSFRSYPLADPPRAVIVIEGITNTTDPSVLIIEDRFVDRVRLVLHEERNPPELLLVFDLATDAARILHLDHVGHQVTAVVGVPPTGHPTPSPVTLPTGKPTRTVAPRAVVPTSPPSATPTPRPPSSPTPMATPTPTNAASYPDKPAPPVLPVVPENTTVSTPSPPARQPYDLATPSPAAEPTDASRAIDLTTGHRSDGSTLLRVTADGRLAKGCARYLEVAGDPPRIVLTIRGISAPDLPRSMEIGDANIDRVRLIHDAETSEGELHIVLHLTGPGISVTELKQVGPHLVVLLAPADSTQLTE